MKKHIIVLAIAALFYLPQAMAQDANMPPPPPHEGHPNIEKKINEINEKLNKEIQLNDDQKVKVANAYKEFFKAIEKERKKGAEEEQQGEHHGPLPKEVMDRLSKERDDKIKAVLKDDQFAKYVEIEKTLRPKRPHGPNDENHEGHPMHNAKQAPPEQ